MQSSGSAGVLLPPKGYLKRIREICDKHGILLVCDEVMAGWGRTGKLFAFEHGDIIPDIVTMAKGLTSGYMPLGAVGLRDPIAQHKFGHVAQVWLAIPSPTFRMPASTSLVQGPMTYVIGAAKTSPWRGVSCIPPAFCTSPVAPWSLCGR